MRRVKNLPGGKHQVIFSLSRVDMVRQFYSGSKTLGRLVQGKRCEDKRLLDKVAQWRSSSDLAGSTRKGRHDEGDRDSTIVPCTCICNLRCISG